MGSYTALDFVIILIFFASMLTGLSRGFIREIVSLITWIAAFVVASMFSHQLAAVFTSSGVVQNAVQSMGTTDTSQPVSMLALGISFVCLFVGTLIVGSIVNLFLSGAGGLSFTNRILGALFGLVRGYLVNLVLLFLLSLTPFTAQAWWKNSVLVPSFVPAIEWLSQMVQPGLESLKSRMGDTLRDVNTKFQEGVSQIYPGR